MVVLVRLFHLKLQRESSGIEALESLSLDPVKVLLMPRVVATTIMLPLLVCVADLLVF